MAQKTDPPVTHKKPVHLDIHAGERDLEVDPLAALGAHVKQRLETHTWMIDPERNDFCVVQG